MDFWMVDIKGNLKQWGFQHLENITLPGLHGAQEISSAIYYRLVEWLVIFSNFASVCFVFGAVGSNPF